MPRALEFLRLNRNVNLGVRQEWLPLFDQYKVDLVVNGHDHDHERSFPCRGFDMNVGTDIATGAVVNTMRPRPVTTTDSGVFDTSKGTVYLVLGCGGTAANTNVYDVDPSEPGVQGKVTTPDTADHSMTPDELTGVTTS